ncbi:hypothetical protein EDC04DRAFT_277993 [Pisolithus marmoratus]|nr:hypothetical protein EDC04DRAFT_277993 [Pisolithus marmoratus]
MGTCATLSSIPPLSCAPQRMVCRKIMTWLEGGQPQRSRFFRGSAASETLAPPPLAPPPVHGGPLALTAIQNGSKEQFGESGGVYTLKARTGFWRSRKGIITVVVIVVVIIGAVVGGAVGGSTKGTGGQPAGALTGDSSISTPTSPATPTWIQSQGRPIHRPPYCVRSQ